MRRVLGTLAISSLALATLVAGVLVGTGRAVPGKSAASVTKITVTATEFHFKLSKASIPKTGTVAFTVINKGKIGHDFKIAGKKTKLLSPGKSQTLTVKFAKKARYAYRCTVPGHAANGMRGTFAVATRAVTTSTSTNSSTSTSTSTTTVTGPSTTVNVSMKEYKFTLTVNGQVVSSVPQGQITFVIKNDGSLVHNFDVLAHKAGTILSPGQSETWTIGLAANAAGYGYQCDVPFHAEDGMTGSLTVTPS